MTEPINPLPDFERPPVVEVALSVQFKDLPGLTPLQIGVLWQDCYRADFPKTQEHKALDEQEESFDLEGGRNPGLRIRLGVPPTRFWFLNESESDLVQIQRNRFTRNWKRGDKVTEYPRYSTLRARFVQDFEKFLDFVSRENMGQVTPTQCEVTYVNEIESGPGSVGHGELARILRFLVQGGGGFLPAPENEDIGLRFLIRGEDGKPTGRLHVQARACHRVADSRPVHVLELTARGRPQSEGKEEVLRFLDLGREWIVRGFTDSTTTEMHRMWGRKR